MDATRALGRDDLNLQELRPLTEQSQNHNPKTNPHKTPGSIEQELGEKLELSSHESVRTHKNNVV